MKHPDIHSKMPAAALKQKLSEPEPEPELEPECADSSMGEAANAGPRVPAPSNLRSLYDNHFAFVWRNLRRLGVNEQRLEDASQEVFLVAHRRWASFDPSSAAPRTWLFGIVVRVAQNERRTGRRRGARMAPATEHEFWEALPSNALGPAELLAKREAARLLMQTLESLNENERAIFVMVDVESLSVPEAAESLGWKLNTAYGRLRTGRAEFQRALQRLRAGQKRSEG